MSMFLSAMLVVLFLLGTAVPAAPAHPALHCTAPEGVTRFTMALPRTTRAIRRGEALIIVAIGSSSTAGVGASDQAHTYPAVLAEALRQRWPRLAVTVVNKGVSGETAEQTLARFARDVLPYRPQLVIWQTGSNHLLMSEDVQAFENTVRRGIARLKATSMDVILMDPQYAPRVLGRPRHKAIVDTIGRVGTDLKVAVFQRFAVMRHWVTSGQSKMDDVISRDQLHMNDASYGCIARLLAESLATAAVATPPRPKDGPIGAGREFHTGLAAAHRTSELGDLP